MGKKSRKKGANNNKKKSKKSVVSSAPPQQQQPPSHRDETSTTNTTNKREFFVGDRVWFWDKFVVNLYNPNTFRGYIGKIDGSTMGIITFHSLMEGRDEEMVWGELIVIVSCYINVWYIVSNL